MTVTTITTVSTIATIAPSEIGSVSLKTTLLVIFINEFVIGIFHFTNK